MDLGLGHVGWLVPLSYQSLFSLILGSRPACPTILAYFLNF